MEQWCVLPLQLSHQPEKSALDFPALMQPKTNQHGCEHPRTHSIHFDYLYDLLQTLISSNCTNCSSRRDLQYIPPRRHTWGCSAAVLWSHKSSTAWQYDWNPELSQYNTMTCHLCLKHRSYYANTLYSNKENNKRSGMYFLYSRSYIQIIFTWTAVFSSVLVLSVLSCGLTIKRKK